MISPIPMLFGLCLLIESYTYILIIAITIMYFYKAPENYVKCLSLNFM